MHFLKTMIFAVVSGLLFINPVIAQTQRDFSYLKKWANEYPIEKEKHPPQDFFSLPEIKAPLMSVLGLANFKRLLNAFGLVEPIDLINGYLVLRGFTNNHLSQVDERALVVVRLSNGAIHVGMERNGKVEIFSTEGKFSDLPIEIRAEIDPEAAEEWGQKLISSARSRR